MSERRFFEATELRRDSKNELVPTVVLRLEHDKGLSKVERDATPQDKLDFPVEFAEFNKTKKEKK